MTKEQRIEKDWQEWKGNVTHSIITLGKVLFFPLFLAWGAVHGIKAGLTVTLEVMTAWEG